MPPSRLHHNDTRRSDRGAIDRVKQLDLEHRKRLRGAARLTLSLRFLSTAWARLRGSTQPARPLQVSHPPEGALAVTFVGHATVMITTPRTRVLTDPMLDDFFFGLRRATAAGLHHADRDAVDLVLISHAHRDHLHDNSLRLLPSTARVIVPPRCGALVTRLGFDDVVELGPGASVSHKDVEITAVPARHSGVRGLGDYTRRGAAGYVLRSQGTTLYFAGDTAYFSGFAEIGRRFNPDVALLPIGGYEPNGFRDQHMSPLDAVYAFEDLGARVLIPINHGSFPLSYEPLEAPTAWLRQLARQRGLVGTLNDEDRRRVALLNNGETCAFRRR
ncbi:MAG TPA: MBL fold metallo-hydrolase [Polyangia bacterium]|nr:MBL fold metallo-hydrolase [Polyangia bacterium]